MAPDNQMMRFDLPKENSSMIKVIGVGGGGSNAVSHMHSCGINGVDFIISNTDNQALDNSSVPLKVQLGSSLTEGRGAGSIPEVGKNAAIESIDEIRAMLEHNTSMVFITAGMGGGTGTGAAPIIAKVAKDLGILTVGIVTMPFGFEGKKRLQQAEVGVNELREAVDSLLIIQNDKLREIYGNLTIKEAFAKADDVLSVAARGITQVVSSIGEVNIDMNDVNTVMKESGVAIMGTATAEGDNAAVEAAKLALESPLLNDNDIYGAKDVLFYITMGDQENLDLDQFGLVTDYIQKQAGEDANVIWGYGYESHLEKKVGITIIATGFKQNPDLGITSIPSAATEVEEKKTYVSLDDNIKPVEGPITNPFGNFGEMPKTASTANDAEPFLKKPEVQEEPRVESPVSRPAFAPIVEEAKKEITPAAKKENTSVAESQQPSVGFQLNNVNVGETKVEEPRLFAQEETPLPPVSQRRMFTLDENEEIKEIESSDEVSNFHTEDEPKPVAAPKKEMKSTMSVVEKQKVMEERMARIRDMNNRLRTPSGISQLENEPAFKRRNIALKDQRGSDQSNVSKYTLNSDNEIRPNNSFLHDNVD